MIDDFLPAEIQMSFLNGWGNDGREPSHPRAHNKSAANTTAHSVEAGRLPHSGRVP